MAPNKNATIRINIETPINNAEVNIDKLQRKLLALSQSKLNTVKISDNFSDVMVRLDEIKSLTAKGVIDRNGINQSASVLKILRNELQEIEEDFISLRNKTLHTKLEFFDTTKSSQAIKDYKALDNALSRYGDSLEEIEGREKERAKVQNKRDLRAAELDVIIDKNKKLGKSYDEQIEKLDKYIEITKNHAKLKKEAEKDFYSKNTKDKKFNPSSSLYTAWKRESKIGAAYEEHRKELHNIEKTFGDINALKSLRKSLTDAQKQVSELDIQLQALDNIKTTDSQAAIAQLNTAIKAIPSLNMTVNAKTLDKDIEKLQVKLRELAATCDNELDTAFAEIEESAKEAKLSIDPLSDSIVELEERASKASALEDWGKKIAVAFSADRIIDAFVRAVRDAFEAVKELDAAMTETAVVTDFTVDQMWNKMSQMTKIANTLGVTTLNVYETQTLLYQMGLKENQVLGASIEIMKMARIAGLGFADATDAMSSAILGFGMEMNQLNAQKIGDIYSQLAAISASDVEELSTAMSKVASIAANAGMEVANTSALLALGIETTRESAETIGTSLKTVVARFTELKKSPNELVEVEGEIVDANKIEGALRSVGIALRDSNGEIRDLDDVLFELSERWGGLTKNQRAYIATLAAGSRQQSRFISMLSNYNRLTYFQQEALNAAGSMDRQWSKTLESLESKIARFINAWNEFTTGIANSDVIKTGIDLLTNLLEAINNLTNAPGILGSVSKALLFLGVGKFGSSISKTLLNLGTILKESGADSGISFGRAFLTHFGKELKTPGIVTESLGAIWNKVSGSLIDTNRLDQLTNDLGNAKDAYNALLQSFVGKKMSAADTVAMQASVNAINAIKKEIKEVEHSINITEVLNNSLSTLDNFKLSNLSESFDILKTKIGNAGSKLLAFLGANAGIVGAIAAVSVLTIGFMHLANEIKKVDAEYQLKNAQAANEELSNQLTELESKLESTQSAVTEFNNLSSSMDGMIKGTKEWKQQLIEVNNKMLEILELNPDMVTYMKKNSNGMWSIDEEGYNEYIEAQNKQIDEVINAQAANQFISAQLGIKINKEEIIKEARGLINNLYATEIPNDMIEIGVRDTASVINAIAKESLTVTELLENGFVSTQEEAEKLVSLAREYNNLQEGTVSASQNAFIQNVAANTEGISKIAQDIVMSSEMNLDGVAERLREELTWDTDAAGNPFRRSTLSLRNEAEALGISIEDTNGKLKDADVLIEEIVAYKLGDHVRDWVSALDERIADFAYPMQTILRDFIAGAGNLSNAQLSELSWGEHGGLLQLAGITEDNFNNLIKNTQLSDAEISAAAQSTGINEGYITKNISDIANTLGHNIELLNIVLDGFYYRQSSDKDLIASTITGRQETPLGNVMDIGSFFNTLEGQGIQLSAEQQRMTWGEMFGFDNEAMKDFDAYTAIARSIEENADKYSALGAKMAKYVEDGFTEAELTEVAEELGEAYGLEELPLNFIEDYADEIEQVAEKGEEATDELQALQNALDTAVMKEQAQNAMEALQEVIGENGLTVEFAPDMELIYDTIGEISNFELGAIVDFKADTYYMETMYEAALRYCEGRTAEAAQLLEDLFGIQITYTTTEVPVLGLDKNGNMTDELKKVVSGARVIRKNAGGNLSSLAKSISGNKGKSTSGGGGSSNKWENPYDRLYNLTEAINRELREREKLEKRYDRILEARGTTGKELLENSNKELDNLETQRELQKLMLSERQKEMKKFLEDNEKLASYGTYDFESGRTSINWDKINKVTDEDKGEQIEDYISKLEELRDSMDDAEDALWDIDEDIRSINERGLDEYLDLEQRVYDALVYQRQQEIDKLSEINESINTANEKLLDGIQEELDKQRQLRENKEREDEMSEKERRLIYLQQDTSGANDLEILHLQEELQNERQDYTDSLIDQKINELQSQNDKAADQRQRQIELLQAQLDYQAANGEFWEETHGLMHQGISATGELIDDSELKSILADAENWKGMSEAQRGQWADALEDTIALAYVYSTDKGGLAKDLGDIKTGIGKLGDMKVGSNSSGSGGGGGSSSNSLQSNTSTSSSKPAYKYVATYTDSTGKKYTSNYYDTESAAKKAFIEQYARTLWMTEPKWSRLTLEQAKKSIESQVKVSSVKHYAKGGLADFTGPAWLDGSRSKPEIVLNPRDSANFIQLRDILRNFNSTSALEGIGDAYYDIDINVDHLNNDYDVDQLASKIKRIIYDNGSYRNVNTLNRLR